MAQVNNPRKNFNFQISIDGINPFLCQEVKQPDVEFDMVEHGDTNFDVKTAGRKKISQLQITKIFPSDELDTEIRDWASQIQDTTTGGGALPSDYKRVIIVQQYAPDGITVLDQWEYDGCWPQKINGIEFNRRSSENTTQSVEFCVDEEN